MFCVYCRQSLKKECFAADAATMADGQCVTRNRLHGDARQSKEANRQRLDPALTETSQSKASARSQLHNKKQDSTISQVKR